MLYRAIHYKFPENDQFCPITKKMNKWLHYINSLGLAFYFNAGKRLFRMYANVRNLTGMILIIILMPQICGVTYDSQRAFLHQFISSTRQKREAGTIIIALQMRRPNFKWWNSSKVTQLWGARAKTEKPHLARTPCFA